MVFPVSQILNVVRAAPGNRRELVHRPSLISAFRNLPSRYTSTLVPLAPLQASIMYCLVASTLGVTLSTIPPVATVIAAADVPVAPLVSVAVRVTEYVPALA